MQTSWQESQTRNIGKKKISGIQIPPLDLGYNLPVKSNELRYDTHPNPALPNVRTGYTRYFFLVGVNTIQRCLRWYISWWNHALVTFAHPREFDNIDLQHRRHVMDSTASAFDLLLVGEFLLTGTKTLKLALTSYLMLLTAEAPSLGGPPWFFLR